MWPLHLLSLPFMLTAASLVVETPDDVIPPAQWASDNELIANYNTPFYSSQPSDIIAVNVFDHDFATNHATFHADANDTSAILVANASTFDASFIQVTKFGYYSDLLKSSFYGFNAAINVANASKANMDHINVTVHNGAANIYAYGDNTVVHVNDAWLYSSGPVSHGLYASGNATIIGRNIQHFSGGKRSSSFSGDNPSGDLYVYNSVAKTAGIGSATYYVLGSIYAENVYSLSEQGPAMFMDGAHTGVLVNCDATAGLLGGVALFNSQVRKPGSKLVLQDTTLRTSKQDVPGMWFGNIIVDVTLNSSKVLPQGDVLIVANYSQITQDFDHYGDYTDNPGLLPAEVTATTIETSLVGDLVAYNGSSISLSLTKHSSWVGTAYSGFGIAYFDVSLDSTSNWTLTKDTIVQNLTNADAEMSNVHSGGFNLYYNASAPGNSALNGKTFSLVGGGEAKPIGG